VLFIGLFFWVWLGCFPGWASVSRVYFLGASYELGALYLLYLTCPIRFFDIQHYLSKYNLSGSLFIFFSLNVSALIPMTFWLSSFQIIG
jgi:hypothetical protein